MHCIKSIVWVTIAFEEDFASTMSSENVAVLRIEENKMSAISKRANGQKIGCESWDVQNVVNLFIAISIGKLSASNHCYM